MKKMMFAAMMAVLSSCATAQSDKDITLLPPDTDKGASIMKSLAQRQSHRECADKDLGKEDLSNLLWAANGYNRPEEKKRTAPTAMNRQEIDLYVFTKDGIYLYDDEKTITKKVMKAVTDSGPTEQNSAMPEVIENLFTLLKLVSDQSTVDYFTEKWNDCSIRYGDLKKQLAADICKMTLPIKERIDAIYNDDAYLGKVVASGRERARASAAATLSLVKKAIGFKTF